MRAPDFEKRSYIFVCEPQGKNSELGSRKFCVSKIIRDQIRSPAQKSRLKVAFVAEQEPD
ncbi:MAG: hypothetical protein BRC25_03635 [Parcubacteria group bacterium SW_6_46_9]|nr:MAG: hypothetical protein BRC25_03635 [Parcubacteria group bacterium SW_6_46_9]